MPSIDIVRESPVKRTPRVRQIEGMFDLPSSETSSRHWRVDFDLPVEWSIGVIVGPSGAGKSTVAFELFGDHFGSSPSWSDGMSIVDDFDTKMSIKEITELLSSVGFSSPPAWLRPYSVLSNGEKFRADLARIIAQSGGFAIVDEFTSVVDRTVAKIGSAAVAKTVRRRGEKFVAVTCHYDVIDWLDPDWIYEPHINTLTRRSLRGRPSIKLSISRVEKTEWRLFSHHHYLSNNIHKSSRCFVGYVDDVPAVFCALLHFPHSKVGNFKREHRIVCMPDFQGVGLGNKFSAVIGSMCLAMGFRYISITSHPAMIRARAKSLEWDMRCQPNVKSKTISKKGGIAGGNTGPSSTRLRASFEYIGAAMPTESAHRLWNGY